MSPIRQRYHEIANEHFARLRPDNGIHTAKEKARRIAIEEVAVTAKTVEDLREVILIMLAKLP